MAGSVVTTVATAAATAQGYDIFKRLINSFTTEDKKTQNLTEAEELVNGLSYDMYHDTLSCKKLTKIKLSDFRIMVERIADRYEIPQAQKDGILDGELVQKNEEFYKDFVSQGRDEPGKFTFGRVMTIKGEDDTIDLAYVIYNLKFRLPQNRIEEKIQKRFLCFVYKTETVVRYEERKFNDKDQELIETFFFTKALKGLRNQYGSLEYM